MVLGNTNAGKSTFLNGLLGINPLLNTLEDRETSTLWEIKFSSDAFRLESFKKDDEVVASMEFPTLAELRQQIIKLKMNQQGT